jgi:hypothetical protein
MSSEPNLALYPGPKSAESAAFLRCLYDITHANPARRVYVEQVTQALNLAEADAEFIIDILATGELVRLRLQCVLSITQAGIDEVNAALPQPEPQPVEEEEPDFVTTSRLAAQSTLGQTLLGVHASGDLPELPPEPIQQNLAAQDRENLELKLICEAIGLDPGQLDGKTSPPSSIPDAPNGHHAPVPVTSPALAEESARVAKTLTALMLQLANFGLTRDDLAEAEAEIATATAQLLSPRPKQPIIAASLTTLLAILDRAPAATSIDLQVSLTEVRLFRTQFQG